MHKIVKISGGARWQAIVAELVERRILLADKFMARVSQLEDYATGKVDDEDVRDTAVESLQLLTESLAEGKASPALISLASALGARRARQGIPPESLSTAVRLDFSVIWSDLLEICGPDDSALLAGRVEHVWRVVDEYATRTQASYLAERTKLVQEESDVKQEFIAKLFGPAGQSTDVIAKAAAALDVEADGEFAVVAASGEGALALRQFAGSTPRRPTLFLHQSGTFTFGFWQAASSGGSRRRAAPPIGDIPCGLVDGIRGLRSVAAAAGSAASLARVLNEDDRQPLTVENGWARLARRTLHDAGLDLGSPLELRLAECRDAERERLEETVRTFLGSGNVSATAAALYCHRNTILNRLTRFRELTGVDLAVPEQAASVVVAWA